MNSGSLIALFGVSGVGKSYLANAAFERWPSDIVHLVGSDLIASAGEPEPSADESRLSSRKRILANQDLIVREFRRRVPQYTDRVVIFDGHSVVNSGEELIKVPVEIVSALSPQAIVFVQDAPEKIRERRILDQDRDRFVAERDQVDLEQSLALETCKNYSRELSVCMVVCSPSDTSDFERLVEKQIMELPRGSSLD